jgi:hypothetical protein
MTTDVPAWLQALIDAKAGQAEGLRWWSPEERDKVAQARKPTFEGRGLNEEMQQAADEGWRDKLRVGEGPPTYFDHAVPFRLGLWLSTDQPDRLWVGLDRQPPFLWFPAGQDEATLVAALRPYLPTDLAQPRPLMRPLDLVRAARQSAQGPVPGPAPGQDRRARLILGVALNESNVALSEIENRLLVSGFCDPRFLRQGTALGASGGDPTTTVVRTLYSRATVRLDWYESLAGTLFAEIHYAPAGQQDTIGAFNDRFGLDYPLDVPVDVPSLLLGLEAVAAPRMQSILARTEAPERLRYYLYFLAILTNPDVAEPLRPYARHPSPVVRGTVIDLAGQKAPELLREMREAETDPELRARIDAALEG